MKIRPAVSSDKEIIADFQMKLAEETEGLILDRKILLRGIGSLFNDPARGKYFIAEIDKNTIACTMITPEWSDWKCGYYIWLQSVYVMPEHRKKGAFKAIYNYVKDIVSNNIDYRGIRLYVDNTNKSAMEAYRALDLNGEHYQVWEWIK